MIDLAHDGGYHRLAFAMVMALHGEDTQTAAKMADELLDDDLAALVVVLSMWVDEAWTELAVRDKTTFAEFARETGLWLAGGEP